MNRVFEAMQKAGATPVFEDAAEDAKRPLDRLVRCGLCLYFEPKAHRDDDTAGLCHWGSVAPKVAAWAQHDRRMAEDMCELGCNAFVAKTAST